MNIFGNDEEEPQINNNTRVISNSLGIDLGTLNTVIAKPSGDKFDLYQIPSVVAVKKDDPSEVLAVGEEAKKMLGRTPEDILAVRPLKKGVIENVVQAQALLIKAMQIGINEGESVGRIVIGIPGDSSEVEKNAAEEIGRKAGAEYVKVISEGLAAAIGAGLPIAEPNGTMVIDIGAGSTDIVIISLGGINDIENSEVCKKEILENLAKVHEQRKMRGFERIKYLIIDQQEPTVENGLLTPSMKPQFAKMKKLYEDRLLELYKTE